MTHHAALPPDPPGLNVRRLLMLLDAFHTQQPAQSVEMCPCRFSPIHHYWGKPSYPLGVAAFEKEGLNWGCYDKTEMRYRDFLNYQAVKAFFGLAEEQARLIFVDHLDGDQHRRIPSDEMRERILGLVVDRLPGFRPLLEHGRASGLSAQDVLAGYRALMAMAAPPPAQLGMW